MAINKIKFKLNQDIRRRLDKRIRDQDYSSVAALYRWLISLCQDDENISKNTLIRYIKDMKSQTDEVCSAALALRKRPKPEEMHETAIVAELGGLAWLSQVITQRMTALGKTLDALHVAEMQKPQ